MPNPTTNLGLNTWLENEVVNFEEVNQNFEKLDTMVMCIESGTKTSSYSGGSDSVTTWRYKKYSDGTIDMSAKLNFTNLKCNSGSAIPYYSSDLKVYFPFALSEVYDVQMHMASNTIGWVSNITDRSILDYVMFRVMAMELETTDKYKRIFINVKGVFTQ